MTQIRIARVVVAGLAGDTGKSLVSLGLVRALLGMGRRVAPFKKGPDFIDAAWLGAAAEAPGRNLDTYLMEKGAILRSLLRASGGAEIAVIEGNRGLFDGMDSAGSHSTAELAKLIGAPVVLVVDATKTTRTIAAIVKGCQVTDPELALAGVVLNRIGTKRQESVIREAVANETGLPVLGAIPKLKEQHLPSRHLGLVTAMEHPDVSQALEKVGEAIREHLDLDAVWAIASEAGGTPPVPVEKPAKISKTKMRIGVLQDEAFSFYYPENLEALENAGASLIRISALRDQEVPPIDALYVGGGFPEVHAERLSANEPFRKALRDRIEKGLPVWAECGGLMYLSNALIQNGKSYPLVGSLPIEVEQMARPQGHGYVMAKVDKDNRFLPSGTEIKGHEFHYSRLRGDARDISTAFNVSRGEGVGCGRDGIQVGSVMAMYTHIHALGTPEWAEGLIGAGSQTDKK